MKSQDGSSRAVHTRSHGEKVMVVSHRGPKSKPQWDTASPHQGGQTTKTDHSGCGEDVRMCTLGHRWGGRTLVPLWKAVWQFLKKLSSKLPNDSAIPVLGRYLRDWNHMPTQTLANYCHLIKKFSPFYFLFTVFQLCRDITDMELCIRLRCSA